MLKKGIFAFPILFYMHIQKCLNNSYYPMKWTILDKIGRIVAKIGHIQSWIFYTFVAENDDRKSFLLLKGNLNY